MTEIFTIKMEKQVYGGDCLGRLPDGRAVFVPFVLPGEVVRVELVEEKKRYAHARPVEILQSLPERISPLCIHFGICGGCQYQHIDYTKQLALKEDLLRDQFQRIAHIENPPIQPIVPSPDPWHYRNHIQFHLSQKGELGFVHADGKHLLIIEECHLPQAGINETWPQLDLGGQSGVYRLGIRQDSYDDIMLIIEGEEAQPPEFSVDTSISAVYTPAEAPLTLLAGDDHLTFTVFDRPFQVSARSFFQVNLGVAEKMVTHLLANLHLTEHTYAVELYAGVGLFSAFLAEKVGHLTAVESSGSACYDFAVNLDEFENVSLYEAPAEAVLPSLETPVDLLVMDPPRAGLAPAVHDALAELQPAQIAYISCDPATLARDVKRILGNGYRLESITPFDMFPHTAHVETMTVLRRTQRVTS